MVWLYRGNKHVQYMYTGVDHSMFFFPFLKAILMPETKDAKIFYLGNIFSQSKIEFLLQKNYGTSHFQISVSNALHS